MKKEGRYLIFAAVFTFAAFAAAIYTAVKLPHINLLGGNPPEKVIEFKGTRLSGWKEGRKQWEIYAEGIWYTKNQSITTFERVKDGILFKDGRAVVKGLKARQIKYNKWTEEIEAFSFLPSDTAEGRALESMIDLNNVGSKEGRVEEPRFAYLTADHLLYSARSGKAEAKGRVRIIEKDLRIFADRMDLADNSNKADISGNVRIVKKDTMIKSEKMHADFSSDRYSFSGNVEITQKEKAAVCDTATLENKSGELLLEGRVKFLIEKGTALIMEGSAKSLRNPETIKSLKEKTVLTCDRLLLSTKTRDAQAFGKVEITQKEKRARSETAAYSGAREEIVMTGNVYFEKGGEWLKTQKVLVSVSGESFEAAGQVEAEFKIKK